MLNLAEFMLMAVGILVALFDIAADHWLADTSPG